MNKEEFEALLAGTGEPVDTGPIEPHIRALAVEERLPKLAIALCTARFDDAAPTLRAVLARAAEGEVLSDDDATLLFRGLHIMGGARDSAAFQPLLRLLHRSAEDLEYLLGDGITEGLGKIAAGMFDGDVDGLFDAIASRSVSEHVRSALFETAAFLVWERRVERERLRDLLVRFYDERLANDDDFAWLGWMQAIALLGFRDLAPLVHKAWDEGRITDCLLDREDFEHDLREAERRPNDVDRLKDANFGYIEDVVEALAWSDHVEPSKADDEASSLWGSAQSYAGPPMTNPWRHVGRNDPCPCGSGKKAKKCCLPH